MFRLSDERSCDRLSLIEHNYSLHGYPTSLTMQIKDLSPLHGEMIKTYGMILLATCENILPLFEWLFVVSPPIENIHFSPMETSSVKIYGVWAERHLYLATSAQTQGLGFRYHPKDRSDSVAFYDKGCVFWGHILNQNNGRYHWTNFKKT